MIKVISFGTNDAANRLSIIQRNGKKIALALVINIETISENIAKIDSETAVTFSVEEVPLAAARKVLADTAEGHPALIALEYGKQVSEDVLAVISEFVTRSVQTLPL